MKVLKLYDLKSGEVTALPNIREAENAKKKQRMHRKIFQIAFTAFEMFISLSVGLLLYQAMYESLKEIRGTDAVGGEIILIILVTIGTFLVLEKLGDAAWKRKKSRR